ncbi:Phosphonate ABC transporter phosphate-binding periplasmic component (TC 3.A.1.9.1) [hydrothermal vent metagenome]|uniref:Phosphonate ABC transporter phosphate-binding periplasmic component (TC 3.A.1.9.1) n=1 Tax=hydrothermal vent metagenome TaxID=652676 RepID=A0A3B0ZCN0_9ZZZZ
MKPSPLTITTCFIAILLTCASGGAISAQSLSAKTFSVGIVPQFDSRKIHKIWRPILKELEKSTGYKFRLQGAPTIPAFEKKLNVGYFDFAYMNPYHALRANNHQGYIPLVRDIEKPLQGILVVKKGGHVNKIEELANQTVSFPAPNALGASLMIRAELEDFFEIQVQPQYVKTHSSVYLNVVLGITKAGGGVQKTLDQQPSEVRDALQILYKTRHVVPHPISAHPRVSSEVIKQVTETLLSLSNTTQGLKMLKKIPIKKIGPTSLKDYTSLNNLGLERFYHE